MQNKNIHYKLAPVLDKNDINILFNRYTMHKKNNLTN